MNVDKIPVLESSTPTSPSLTMRNHKIIRRAREINGQIQEQSPVVITLADLEAYFSLPLQVAAQQLGVCTTSLKWYVLISLDLSYEGLSMFTSYFSFSACRKFGIRKWPFRKVRLCFELDVGQSTRHIYSFTAAHSTYLQFKPLLYISSLYLLAVQVSGPHSSSHRSPNQSFVASLSPTAYFAKQYPGPSAGSLADFCRREQLPDSRPFLWVQHII